MHGGTAGSFFLFFELMLGGPVLLVLLPGPGDGEGHGRDVVGDGGACGDVRTVPDRDGRDEVRVAADEGVIPDGGAVFFRAVIVDRHGAAAEVAVPADIAVTDVGEVRDLGAVGNVGVLISTKSPTRMWLPIVEPGRM